MTLSPCPLCGYDAPGSACRHCGLAPREPTLRVAPRGLLHGVVDGVLAVPYGLWFLLSTRGTKRWCLPPMVLSALGLAGISWMIWRLVARLFDAAVPEDFDAEFLRWSWLESRPAGWAWLQATWAAVTGALAWVLDHLLALLPRTLGKLFAWWLLTLLAGWYLFSLGYEALAGPFLDEIQGRIEERWFGVDPRKRLTRPTEIPVARCVRRSLQWIGAALALVALAALLPGVPFWFGLLGFPVAVGLAVRLDAEYGKWLAWVARIEVRAFWVGVQASLVTGILTVVALPLFFLQPIGPPLFATIVGCATAVTLLDIAFERRGWALRERLRFVLRNLPAMAAFGATSGALLALPVVGWAVMVPCASVGGLWLVCRIDKNGLRPRGREIPRERRTGAPKPAGAAPRERR
jgi:uncharacterized protein involved in cysteine biosynthesis